MYYFEIVHSFPISYFSPQNVNCGWFVSLNEHASVSLQGVLSVVTTRFLSSQFWYKFLLKSFNAKLRSKRYKKCFRRLNFFLVSLSAMSSSCSTTDEPAGLSELKRPKAKGIQVLCKVLIWLSSFKPLPDSLTCTALSVWQTGIWTRSWNCSQPLTSFAKVSISTPLWFQVTPNFSSLAKWINVRASCFDGCWCTLGLVLCRNSSCEVRQPTHW